MIAAALRAASTQEYALQYMYTCLELLNSVYATCSACTRTVLACAPIEHLHTLLHYTRYTV
jgi:hypothetical protein